MLIKKILSAMMLVVLLFGNIFAQQSTVSTSKLPELSPELRKNAVELLRQTIKEIPNLKAEENRQYFTIETAYLLWKYDEKESRTMFEGVIKSVKQTMAKTAADYKKAIEEARKKAKANPNRVYSVNAANTYYSNRVANAKANVLMNTVADYEPEIGIYEVGFINDFRKLANLRRRLAITLTETEPMLAYQFLQDTSQMIPKEFNLYSYLDSSTSIEKKLITEMIKRKEVDKSIEIARSVFNKDNSQEFSYILIEIYDVDAVKGSQFAEETLQKLKTSPKTELSVYEIDNFFDFAEGFKQESQPLLSDKSLRELAKMLGQSVLAEMDAENYYDPSYYAKKIKDYAPREALQIVQKSKLKKKPRYPSNTANYASNYYSVNANVPYYARNTAVNANREVSNTATNVAYNSVANSPKPKNNSNSQTVYIPPISDDWKPTLDSKYGLLEMLRKGKFTPEERKKVIAKAKEYALESNPWGYSRPDGFVPVIMELARFSLISADKEVADELMKEAEVYVRPETKTFIDYASKLILAGGYSSHQPDKSFAIMESLISINEVIESAIKIGVFIDSDSTYILNNEVSAAYFLGEMGAIQNLSKDGELPMFIRNLAKTDFQRTKGLADKFEKNEFKMTAKVLILSSLLGENSENNY